MGWEQAGYGIHPFQGIKAPNVDVGFINGRTVFAVSFQGKMVFEEQEKVAKKLYDEGVKFLNPPDLDARNASASKLNIKTLTAIKDEMQENFLSHFCGITVRQDYKLPANQWYCAVSPEIYEALTEQSETSDAEN